MNSVCIVGGAGFIGSHFVEHLVNTSNDRVVVVDDLSSGGLERINPFLDEPRVRFVQLDAREIESLTTTLKQNCVDTVVHLASNPDIAAAMDNPTIDFDCGTLITQSVVEASRLANVRTILYASGSGVYGDCGDELCIESSTVPHPISTYGASKLAGETLLSAYSHMSSIRCLGFRFGNVVGHRATHGVYYDFVNRLFDNPLELNVRGNGNQSKSYVHVSDVISAVFKAESQQKSGFEVYNVATRDYLTVREIVEMAITTGGLNRDCVKIRYEESERGWLGDVPVVRLSSEKIRALGWDNKYSSREAMLNALNSRWEEVRGS